MKKINQQQAQDEVRYFRIIETGECIYGLAYQWDAKVDLASRTYVSRFEESEHASSTLPSINELVANGTLEEVNELEELDITGKEVDLQNFDAVVVYAKERGFNIEREKRWNIISMLGYGISRVDTVAKSVMFLPLVAAIHSGTGFQNWMIGWIGRRPTALKLI